MAKAKTEAVIMAKDSQRKKDFDEKYMVFVAFKLFRRTEKGENDQSIIDFLDGKNKSAVIKTALREYISAQTNTTITTPAKGEKGQGEKE